MKINCILYCSCTFITPITTLSQYSMSCPHDINVSKGCYNHEQLKSNKLLTEVKTIGVLCMDLNDKSNWCKGPKLELYGKLTEITLHL